MIECNQIDASAAVPRQGMGIRLAFRAHAENISSSSRRKPTRNRRSVILRGPRVVIASPFYFERVERHRRF
ncbi:hypothetical protein ACFX16_031560 [Malus domestica]